MSNKSLLFCGFEVCQASRPSYLDRLCSIIAGGMDGYTSMAGEQIRQHHKAKRGGYIHY
jgi:hypothetical protein